MIRPILVASIAAQLALVASASAQSPYTFVPVTAGPHDWTDDANWTGSGIPNAVGDVANVTVDFTAAATVNLNTNITVGTLSMNDTGATGDVAITLAPGIAGTLTFQGTAGASTLTLAGLTDTISAPVTLNDALTATTSTTSNSVISGAIGGNGSLTKAGTTNLTLSGTGNTYSGGTTLSAGSITVAAGSTLGANVAANPVNVNPTGRLLLGDAAALGSLQPLTISSNATALGVVILASNAVPAGLTNTSSGVVAIGGVTGFNAVTDLSLLGNGSLFLGVNGNSTFTGTQLAPGVGNVYRLGGGNGGTGGGATSSTLALSTSVLVGDAAAEIGSTLVNGAGEVRFDAQQTYSGGTTIRGPVVPLGATAQASNGVLGLNIANALPNSTITIGSGGVLALRQNNALSTTVATPLTVQTGGRLLVSNSLANNPTAAINRDVFLPAGSQLEIASNGLTGTGVLTKDAGVLVRLSTAAALSGAQFTGSTIVPGDTVEISAAGLTSSSIPHAPGIIYRASIASALAGTALPASSIIAGEIVQVNIDNPTNLGAVASGTIIEIFGASRAINNNTGGLALNGQILTNDAISRQVNNAANTITSTTGFTVAATTGTTLTFQEDIVGSGATLTVGSTNVLNGLAKAGTVAVVGGSTADTSGIIDLGATGTINVVSGALAQQSGGSATIITGTMNLAAGTTFNKSTGSTTNVGAFAGAGTVTASAGQINLNGTASGTLSGVLAGTIPVVKTGDGTQILGGTAANTITGNITVSAGILALAKTAGVNAVGATGSLTVDGTGTLRLDSSNQIPNAKALTLGGGTLQRNVGASEGTTAVDGIGALSLTANSTVDFGNFAGDVGTLTFETFAPGAFTLNIANWTGFAQTAGDATTDRLVFNSDQTANLGAFNFVGFGPGAQQVALGNNYFEIVAAVPEPSALVSLLGGLGMLAGFRRRRAAC